MGGRPDLLARQIGSGFTRIFVGLTGFRVGHGAARLALNTNCRNEKRELELKLMPHVFRLEKKITLATIQLLLQL